MPQAEHVALRRRKVPGVGKMTQRMLAAFGMEAGGDLLAPQHQGVLWVSRAARAALRGGVRRA